MPACPTCKSLQGLKVRSLSTGIIRPGLTGTATFEEIRTVYLGPNYVETQIPCYTVILDNAPPGTKFNGCQAGRDFDFITE
jgi:hypothetical protein